MYNHFEKSLTDLLNLRDIEYRHIEADVVLKEIAIEAAHGSLSVVEVRSLITIYDKIEKWFA